jgi:hypothetical protein
MVSCAQNPSLSRLNYINVNERPSIDFLQPHQLAHIFQQAILTIQTSIRLVIYYLQNAFVKSHRSLLQHAFLESDYEEARW